MAPPSSSATSTQLPLGLLAWLLRHRAETSWSAGTPLLTCIFLLFLKYWEKERNAIGCARPLTPSAPCSLTEQMHLHKYVQRNLADATGKRKVHAPENFASGYERLPSAAITPSRAPPALRPRLAAQRPQLVPYDGSVLGPDQHESGEPGRLEPFALRAELPAPPHRLHHVPGPGQLAHLPRHR